MFYDEIKAYCKANKMPVYKFEMMCEIANGSVNRWKDDKVTPNVRTLIKIAEATGQDIHYLIDLF